MKKLFSRPSLMLAFLAGATLTVAGFVFGVFVPVTPLAQLGALAVLGGVALLSLGVAVLFTEKGFIPWLRSNIENRISAGWQVIAMLGLMMVCAALIGVMRLVALLPDDVVPLIGEFLVWLLVVPLFMAVLPLMVVIVSLSVKLDRFVSGKLGPDAFKKDAFKKDVITALNGGVALEQKIEEKREAIQNRATTGQE